MPPANLASLEGMATQIGVPPRDLVRAIQRGFEDPVFWGETILGSRYWPIQREILLAVRDYPQVNVPACHASGKSFTAGDACLWFSQNFPASNIVVTSAPSERQVRRILWKEIRAKHRKARIPLAGQVDTLKIEIDDEHWMVGFATSDYDDTKFQGLHADHVLVVLDEATGISPSVHEGVAGVLGGGHARLLQLGNPTDPLTQFARDCSDTSPGNRTLHISAYDTPNFNIPAGHPRADGTPLPHPIALRERNFIVDLKEPDHWTRLLEPLWDPQARTHRLPFPALCTPQYVDMMVRKYGVTSPQYIGRVLGRFPEQAENALFSIAEIDEACGIGCGPASPAVDFSRDPRVTEAPVQLGVDVARFGSNQTVIFAYQGDEDRGIARMVARFGKASTTTTVDRIADECARLRRHGIVPTQINVDVIGVGAGVVDQLAQRHLPVVAFNSSSRPDGIPAEFSNLRAYAYFRLKDRLERRQLQIVADPGMKQELLTIRYHQPDGSIAMQILGKEWMRAHNIASPDMADALMIATYMGARSRNDLGITV